MFFQKLFGHFCRVTTRFFRLETSGTSWSGQIHKNGAGSEWSYFNYFGPKMLIIRNGRIQYLMGSFTIRVEYDSEDQKGRILGCKPVFMMRKKSDRVIFGSKHVYREYAKLRHI